MAGIFVATVFIFVVLFAELPKAIGFCRTETITDRNKTYPADSYSGCFGTFQYQICVGYCLSSEIPDLWGSSEIEKHSVCIPAARQDVSRLIEWTCPPFFDSRPATRLNFTEPTSCKCSVCDSKDTSCQLLYKRTMNSRVRFQPFSRRIYVPVAESKKRKEWDLEYPPSIYLI